MAAMDGFSAWIKTSRAGAFQTLEDSDDDSDSMGEDDDSAAQYDDKPSDAQGSAS